MLLGRRAMPEPEATRRLTFIPQTGGPIGDPAVRRETKQQIMRHLGKNRRKAGLVRRQPILQYSLEILHTGWADASATNSLPISGPQIRGNGGHATRLDTTCPAEEKRCDPAAVGTFTPGRPSFDRLGVGLLDPFMHYPFRLDDRARELMCTGLSLCTC